MENRRGYIFNYAFIVSLLVLTLNDHVLKAAFGNWFTGKLSDLAGMVVLPLLLAFIFPKLRAHAIWVSVVLFAFWKSPFSEGLIGWYNEYAIIGIERVVDYSDLVAFAILPLPYYIIKNKASVAFLRFKNLQFSPAYIVVPCVFVLMATSPPEKSYYTRSTGNLEFYSANVRVHQTPEEILEKIRLRGIVPVRDTTKHLPQRLRKGNNDNDVSYYKIPEIIIDKDTLTDLEFSFKSNGKKTRIYLISVNVERNLSDEEVQKKLRKYYKKAAKKYFRKTLK